jgi:hypothetical protein
MSTKMALTEVYSINRAKPKQGRATSRGMIAALTEHFRCPDEFLPLELGGQLSADSGYFEFDENAICYGRSASGYRSDDVRSQLYCASQDVRDNGSAVLLPFDPTEIINNLRRELYVRRTNWNELTAGSRWARNLYYLFRPWLSVGVRKHLQRAYLSGWRHKAFPRWPVDTSVEDIGEQMLLRSMKVQGIERIPFIWFWPDGADNCVLMTHDVESQVGHDQCSDLMNLDDEFEIKASFQVVPEGPYSVADSLLEEMRDRGFELNVQDLNHDGHLFAERSEFLRRAKKINKYGKDYGAKGFRAAVLYRNFEWMDALEFSYDMSVPNVAHLDPQHGGCCSVMPYFVGDTLEIPLTTTQDYMLFHIIGDYSLDLWKTQVAAIREKHGLISFLVHPDYIIEQRARNTYRDLLNWLAELRSQQQLWFALPAEVDEWWRARRQMRLVKRGGGWTIDGPMADQAVLAYATIAGDRISYEFDRSPRIVAGRDSRRADTIS